MVVKAFGAESVRIAPLPRRRATACGRRNLHYVLQQAISSPLIEFFGAVTIVGLLTYARDADQGAGR